MTNNFDSGAAPTTAIEGMDAVREYDEGLDNNDAHLTEAEKQMRDEELSFYSNSTNAHGDDNIWGLLSGVGGNIYEWYVYSIQYTQGGFVFVAWQRRERRVALSLSSAVRRTNTQTA
jgi:hypothetical protein